MSFLPRSGSLAKLVGVLAVVAAMACTGIWYMTSQMQRIDASYARFLDREARAWVAAPRLRSSLVYFQSLVYRIIAETTDDAMKALVPQFDRTAEEALRFAAIIRENAPAYEQEVAAIEGGLKTLREEAKPIIEMALDSAYDKGLELAHQRVNPVIETAIRQSEAIRDRLDAEIAKGSGELGVTTGTTVRTTWMVLGVVLALALVAAFLGTNLAARRRKADMRKLADGFEGAVGKIVQSVSSAASGLEGAATTLTRTADTTEQLSTAAASASEQASNNVQSVASATDELTASVTEIGRQVQDSSRIAAEAVQRAQKTDARIADLSHAASRIGDVVKLITAIAEQTNLLALNATIEAARAGEAGRGFAVVASEVKALAGQTAKATDDISAQIASMQTATHDSVAAIRDISDTIGRISQIASTIAAAVEEQGAATAEIARNVQQAAEGTTQVAANIADVSRGAGETGSASNQVLASARELASQGGKLRLEVESFLATVRAA
jgi:methyl-accepting chemotaxis protein